MINKILINHLNFKDLTFLFFWLDLNIENCFFNLKNSSWKKMIFQIE